MITLQTGTQFKRKELYDLLTIMPLREVAKNYQLIITDLWRCVEKYNIPVRKPEDWTKILMGEKVYREPLTGDPDELVFVERMIPPKSATKGENEGKDRNSALLNQSSHEVITQQSAKTSVDRNGENSSTISGQISPRTYSSRNGERVTRSATTLKSNNISVRQFGEDDRRISIYRLLEIIPDDEYKKVKLSALKLSARPFNALKEKKIDTLHAVMLKSIAQLMSIRNLGVTSIEEIVNSCKRYYLKHTKSRTDNLYGTSEQTNKAATVNSNAAHGSYAIEKQKQEAVTRIRSAAGGNEKQVPVLPAPVKRSTYAKPPMNPINRITTPKAYYKNITREVAEKMVIDRHRKGYATEHQKVIYDTLNLRVRKDSGLKNAIRIFAMRKGMSANEYIKEAVVNQLAFDGYIPGGDYPEDFPGEDFLW